MKAVKISGLNVVIIDDELNSRELLRRFLESYCQGVNVIGEAQSVQTGINLINSSNPDLVFLDIEMSGGTGFDILENFKEASFLTCFVTGYEQYAIKAIKVGAFDYLLKPVEIGELKAVVEKAKEVTMSKRENPSIIINESGRFMVIKTDDIIKVEVDGNYTFLYLEDNRRVISNEKLGHFEEILPESLFYRTHKSHIISLKHIVELKKSRTGSVTLSDKSIVPIASRRMKDFLERLEAYKSNF